MKKTLAIVLALVMVLAMVPAAFAADKTEVTENKNYTIKVDAWATGDTPALNKELKAPTTGKEVSFEYNLNGLKATTADKFADDKYMAMVTVDGFNTFPITGTPAAITVNGKKLEVGTKVFEAKATGTSVSFPIELPKSGINMNYEIVVEFEVTSGTAPDPIVTTLKREIAKIKVSGANSAIYKDERKASFSVSAKDGNAYIVGSTVYVDYEGVIIDTDELTFTLKNDAGALFSEVAYAKSEKAALALKTPLTDDGDKKLNDKSAVVTIPAFNAASTDLTAKLSGNKLTVETRTAKYVTSEFDIIARAKVAKVDPKGIYFAESTKTIKIGESYTPVVMGVVTNLPVKDAELKMSATSSQELSLINIIDKKTVYGLAAGSTYITAEYTTYTASSMKITVLNELFQGPATGIEKYVTCRTLNVRAGAGTSYKIVGKLSRNTKVAVLETANGWSKISFNGGTAYVSDKYLAK